MRRIVAALAALVPIAAAVAFPFWLRESRDAEQWEKAARYQKPEVDETKKNQALEGYLNVCPEGRHAAEARDLIDERAMWTRATAAPSETLFQQYLDRHANGARAADARRRLAEERSANEDLGKVSRAELASWVAFLKKHPGTGAARDADKPARDALKTVIDAIARSSERFEATKLPGSALVVDASMASSEVGAYLPEALRGSLEDCRIVIVREQSKESSGLYTSYGMGGHVGPEVGYRTTTRLRFIDLEKRVDLGTWRTEAAPGRTVSSEAELNGDTRPAEKEFLRALVYGK